MKARVKNVARGIKSSLNRFLSILFIVALGSGFMAGLAATSPDMYETADRYMDDYNWYDIDIKSTIGFKDSNVSAVNNNEYIDEVQASKVFDIVYDDTNNESEYTTRVYGFIDNNEGHSTLNQTCLTDGRYPQNANECVIQSCTGNYMGAVPSIGDTLKVDADSANYSTIKEYIATEELTVVGYVEAPMCISVESETTTVGSGSIGLDVYVQEDFYICDFYTDIYVTFEDAKDLNSFEDEYSDLTDKVYASLETLGKTEGHNRAQEIRDESNAQIDKVETSFKNIYYSAGYTEDTLTSDSLVPVSVFEYVKASIDTSTEEGQLMVDYINQIIEGETSYIAYSKCDDLINELREKANNAVNDDNWILRIRDDAVGFNSYSSNVGKVAALSKIFPVFFFLVSLLVALTTMTRLVDENRTQIGTLKALGFSNGQILTEYMLYSLFASLLGCILGLVIGFKLFPSVISSAYGMMYWLPSTYTPFRLNIALTVAPITIVSILLATFWAVFANFKAMPSELMVAKAPTPGKRILLEKIPFIWKHLSFTHKVTCRNLFRYKKRLFMTIIGVAGCSALLLTGFGLKDSINDIVSKQFDDIYNYDLTLVTSDNKAASINSDLLTYLDNEDDFTSWGYFQSESGRAVVGSTSRTLTILCPEDPVNISTFIDIRERKSQKKLSLDDDGVIVNEKLCEELGISKGDTIALENENSEKKDVKVVGVCENYLSSFVYITPALYSSLFSNEIEYTTILCVTNDNADVSVLTNELLYFDEVLYAKTSSSIRTTFSDTIQSINGVVWVLIISAGLLCIVVLYNLINVNICERRKELATIKVLGFHKHEVQRYIFRETNTLSVIGGLVGLGIGVWLHQFVVKTVEINGVMFGRTIYFPSYLYAIGITVIFTLIVNLIMRLQINKIDMVEAMKSNE